MASSSKAGAHSATAAEEFSTPPAPGWTENVFKLFQILVVCEDIPRLESVSSGLRACGYYVETINSFGRALEMLYAPNARFHFIFLDASVKSISLKKMLSIIQNLFESICIVVMTAHYNLQDAKVCINQGALLVLPYDRIESLYYILWQLVVLKWRFNSELKSVSDQRKKIYWDSARADFEHAYGLADRTASSIAEQTSVSGINTQSVAGFMRETGVYAGAGPLVGQPSSFLAHIGVQEASALDVAPSDVGARDPLADA